MHVFATPSYDIIFNLKRKNKQLGIAVGMYTCIYNGFLTERGVIIFVFRAPT
jgi:hypothetical protein